MNNNTGYPSIDKTHEKGLKYFDKHPIIPDMSIVNSIGLISSFYRDANAIDCLDLKVTYQELLDTSKILSKSFKEIGIKKDDIITVSMPNFFQAVACFLAANRIGAVTTFLNLGCSLEETKYYLNTFESPLYINYDKDMEYNKDIRKDTKVKQVITLKKRHLNIKTFNEIKNDMIGYNDYLSFNDLKLVADYYKGFINPLQSGKQDSLILFTSGSTGMPKSVVLTNENILASGIYMKNTSNVKSTVVGEKCLVCVPFAYPYGFATSTLMSLLCGREAILAPTLTKENIEYYLKKNPNYVFGSPALLELIKRNTADDVDLSSIHSFISGGDFLSPQNAIDGKEFFKLHGGNVEIYNGSGNAESSGASTIAVGSIVKPETVGRVLVGTDAIIIDSDTMKELKYGEEGMLCISGKHVFKEYYNNIEVTDSSKFMYKNKEYLKTGTIGKLDEEGYFTLTGRSSRFYIRSDLNKVYLEHVQQALSNIDIVDSCVVVKKPDNDLLFTSKAYVVLKDGVSRDEAVKYYLIEKSKGKITNKLNGEILQLKDFEIPAEVEFIDEIPRTVADKIDYTLLEQLAQKEYNEENKLKKIVKG